MQCLRRSIIAPVLILIYSLIMLSPLAPLTMLSPTVAHAVTGECVGDCAICGCSAERKANHTCCCWQKKLKEQHAHDHDGDCDHEDEKVPECCKKKHREHAGRPVLKCNCPCGSNKVIGLWNGEKFEQLPYRFVARLTVFHEDETYPSLKNRLTDRRGAPPDPPPKLSRLS
jgi:hypothetical protein